MLPEARGEGPNPGSQTTGPRHLLGGCEDFVHGSLKTSRMGLVFGFFLRVLEEFPGFGLSRV